MSDRGYVFTLSQSTDILKDYIPLTGKKMTKTVVLFTFL